MACSLLYRAVVWQSFAVTMLLLTCGRVVPTYAGTGTSLVAVPESSEQRGTGEKGGTESSGGLIREGRRPLASVTFAGVDRFVDEARYIFDVSGQTEAFRVVEEWLASTLNNLEGFNRDRPFGIFVYVPVAFPPLPEFLAFVPIDSVEDARKLVEKAPVLVRQDPEREGRYEIVGPQQTVPMLLRNGYAFFPIGNNPPASALDRELPEPTDLVASQARQFDVAVTLDIASIPAGTRTLFSSLITSGMSPQLQRRDDEPEGAYRVRRAEGERVMSALRQLLDECDRVILGVDVVKEQHAVNFEIVVDALAGTKMLQEIFESTTKSSQFIPLLDDTAPVSISMSTVMNERDKNAWVEMLDGLKLEFARQIDIHRLGAPTDEHGAVGQALSAVQETVKSGHLDTFAQFYTDAAQKLAIVGAVRVEDGESIAGGLQDALIRLQDFPDLRTAGDLQVGYNQHLGITFHRLSIRNPPAEATEIFGQNLGITVGCSSSSIWACLGGDESFNTLTNVIDRLEQARQSPQERAAPASLRVIINVNQLIGIQQRLQAGRDAAAAAGAAVAAGAGATESPQDAPAAGSEVQPSATPSDGAASDNDRRALRRSSGFARRREQAAKIFRDTLAEGDDRIEVDFRPTDTGGRIRIRLEEGFVRVLGRIIAARIAPQEP